MNDHLAGEVLSALIDDQLSFPNGLTLSLDQKTLYVDDLVTDAALRSQGHGEAMLKWLIASKR